MYNTPKADLLLAFGWLFVLYFIEYLQAERGCAALQEYVVRPREAALEALRAYLRQNRLKAGDRLPAEREMCEMWSCNRSTLRSAINRLVKSGELEVRPGSGIYYSGDKYRRKLQGLKSFEEETTLQGRPHESRLLAFEKIESDKRLSRLFRVTLGTQLWHLSRLRFADGRVLQIESSYFLAERFPDIDRFDFARDSLYRVFEQEYGVVPTQGEERISTTRVGEEAELLEIPNETPIFRIESRTYDQDGAMLEYCRVMIRPDRVMLISRMETRLAE